MVGLNDVLTYKGCNKKHSKFVTMEHYHTLTVDQLVQRTLGLLQSYHENGQVDANFIEDRIINSILPKFKNQETWLPHECEFEICDRKIELPVKISDVLDVKVYDGANRLVWSFYKPRELYNAQKNFTLVDIGKGFYDIYGHTIKFYSDSFNGYNVKVQFYCFMRDEDGCIVVPEAYSDSIVKYAASEWLLTTAIQQNMQLATIYRQDAINLRNHFKGEANKMSEPQKQLVNAMTQVATFNTGARYIRFWRYYGGGL